MQFTGDWFEDLINNLPLSVSPNERRRAPRIGVRMTIHISVVQEGAVGPSERVCIRDISRMGIGFTHSRPMQPGDRFAISLPRFQGGPLLVLCEVRNCRSLTGSLYAIGAAFLQIGHASHRAQTHASQSAPSSLCAQIRAA